MKRVCALLILLPFISCSQDAAPVTKQYWYPLGIDSISISITDYGGIRQLLFINLHDDEITTLQAALPHLQKNGGVLIRINNSGDRAIRFHLDDKEYAFDPNRIFSEHGIVHTLIRHKRISNRAIGEVKGFADFFLSKLPANAVFIIALHNNIEGSLSINSFLKDGSEKKNSRHASRISNADPDDFMLTTDTKVYKLLRHQFNIVLQDNEQVHDDGSLSVYFGKKATPYLNCETQHGHIREAGRMLGAVYRSLNRIVH